MYTMISKVIKKDVPVYDIQTALVSKNNFVTISDTPEVFEKMYADLKGRFESMGTVYAIAEIVPTQEPGTGPKTMYVPLLHSKRTGEHILLRCLNAGPDGFATIFDSFEAITRALESRNLHTDKNAYEYLVGRLDIVRRLAS